MAAKRRKPLAQQVAVASHDAKPRWGRSVLVVAIGLLLVAAAVGVGLYLNERTHDWRKFTDPDGSFRVEFPGTPRRDDTQVPGENGKTTVKMPTWVVQHTLQGSAYALSYYEVPGKVIAVKDANTFLQGVEGNFLKQAGVKSLYEVPVKVNNYPGLDITMPLGQGDSRLTRIRFVLAKTRLYSLTVAPVPSSNTDALLKHYFDSFAILK
jgi:hypothetical protein